MFSVCSSPGFLSELILLSQSYLEYNRIVVLGLFIHCTFLYLDIFTTGICWPLERLATDLCARGFGLPSVLSSIAIKDFVRHH